MEEVISNISMCRTTTGMGNIIGNACLIVREFIKGLFPKNYFKDEFIDTEMIQKEMDKDFFRKKNKPCLVIKPKISLEDDSMFGKLPDWVNTNYFVYKKLKGNYLPVFCDDENKIYMYCSGERVKISFDIEIILESKLKQINTAYFLKGSVLHKSFFYLNDCRLESEVPKYYVKQIADILNKDLTNEEERSEFNQYLNEHSQHYIEEKIKLSSGNYNHFYLFKANILSLFQNNPEIDDGESEGMTFNNFKVSETLDIEFWCPLNYFLEVGRKFEVLTANKFNYIEEMDNSVNLHYTLSFPLPETYEDMVYYNKIMYLTDEDPKQDVVNISQLFNRQDKLVIKFANEHKIHLSEIFHVDLYLDNYKVDNSSILIDWETFELTNIRPKVNDCYTLVVYKSLERFNRTMHVINHLDGDTYN